MHWTKTKPTRLGKWWMRRAYQRALLFVLDIADFEGRLAVLDDSDYGWVDDFSTDDYEWSSSPIPEPEEEVKP